MKLYRSTSSCQMDIALRPCDRADSMSSRYGSLTLAGKRPVRTVFLRQSKPVILEEWEVREAQRF